MVRSYFNSALLIIIVMLASALSACGGGDEETSNEGPARNEGGNLDNEVDVTGRLPYRGSVGRAGQSYYIITGLDATLTYDVTLSELTGDADMYGGGGRSENSFTASEKVVVSGPAATFTVIDRSDNYIPSYDGAWYTINVVANGGTATVYESEGSIDAPLDLNGLLPYAGSITSDANSYYKITGLIIDAFYEINVTIPNNFQNANLSTYTSSAFDTTQCVKSGAATTGGKYICYAQAINDGLGGGEIYFDVWSAADVALSIDLKLAQSEGAVGSPVILALDSMLPYAGEVAANSISYYQVTGLTPSVLYKVYLTTDRFTNVTLSDSAEAILCNENINNPYCIVTAPPDGIINIKIDFSANLYYGNWYTIDVMPFAPVAEGTLAAPVELSTLLPYTAQVVADNGSRTDAYTSFYSLSGLPAGGNIVISLTSLENKTLKELTGNVYTDASYTTFAMQTYRTDTACSSTWKIALGGSCTVKIPDSGVLYLKFRENDIDYMGNDLGGYFRINTGTF